MVNPTSFSRTTGNGAGPQLQQAFVPHRQGNWFTCLNNDGRNLQAGMKLRQSLGGQSCFLHLFTCPCDCVELRRGPRGSGNSRGFRRRWFQLFLLTAYVAEAHDSCENERRSQNRLAHHDPTSFLSRSFLLLLAQRIKMPTCRGDVYPSL